MVNRSGSKLSDLALFAASSMVALIVLGATLEIVLRIIGYGCPAERVDLFYGFEGANRIFVEHEGSAGGKEYLPAPNKSEFEQGFPVSKPPGTYRIFTLGGSTTRGVPWQHRGSFSWWLEHYLQEAHPETKVEVINLGVSGAGSTRELQIVKEVVDYQPDLFVVYTSQNEFLDAGFYATELKRPPFVSKIMKTLLTSRAVYFTYYRLLVLKARLSKPRLTSYGAKMVADILSEPFSPHSFQSLDYYRVPGIKTSEIQSPTLSDDRSNQPAIRRIKSILKSILGEAGVEAVKNVLGRSEISDEEIFENYDRNVRRMIEIANQNHIKILFLAKARNPQSTNLLGIEAVRKTFFREGNLDDWERHYRDGVRKIKAGECREATADFDKVRSFYLPEFRDSDSLLNLYIGKCYAKLGRYNEAREQFEKRLDKTHARINQITKDVALSFDVPVIDIQPLLTDHAPNGIVGYNVFLDGVHMHRNAYRLIGFTLSEFISSHGYIPTKGRNPGSSEQLSLSNSSEEGTIPAEFQTAKVFTQLGWSEFDQGKYENAIGLGRQAIALDPNELRAHLLLGYSYAKMGRYEEAGQEWNALKEVWTTLLENRTVTTSY